MRVKPQVVDVHLHYLSPGVFEPLRRRPDAYGVRLLEGERVRTSRAPAVPAVPGRVRAPGGVGGPVAAPHEVSFQVGDEAPTRPLLPALHTLDLHLAFLRAQGIDTAVFGPLMDVAGYSLPPARGAAWSRLQNEALAETLRERPGGHAGLATVPLQDPTVAAEELRHAVRDLGLRGAMIDPNALGRPLGDSAFDPFWTAAADLAAPVILHPFLLEAVERFGAHYLHNLVGYPFETTLGASSLILGGTLERIPALTVVLVHGGGFLPYQIGRFDRAHATRPEAREHGIGLPSRYARRFYYDTLVQRPEALRYLAATVGPDRVVLGSDHPFWMGDPEPLRIVREAGLGADETSAILGGNATRIFRLGAGEALRSPSRAPGSPGFPGPCASAGGRSGEASPPR